MANRAPDRAALAAYYLHRHEEDLHRVAEAIARLGCGGWPVNFASVAREAGVGRATLYRHADLRRLLLQARPAQLPGGVWREP